MMIDNEGLRRILTAYDEFADDRFPLPSEEQVASLERRIGVGLPADYRAFLMQFNGGGFSEPAIVPPQNGCPSDALTGMHGIGSTIGECYELGNDVDLFDDNYPAQILPIGHTMMGNLLLLITHEDGRGQILLKVAFSDSTFFLSEDISEFFSLIRSPAIE